MKLKLGILVRIVILAALRRLLRDKSMTNEPEISAAIKEVIEFIELYR